MTEAAAVPCSRHPDAVKPCARCGSFFCSSCTGGELCEACARSAAKEAERANRAQRVGSTVRVSLLLAAFFFGMPGFVSWALGLRNQGESNLGMLLFSAMFAAGPLVTVVLLRLFGRAWMVVLALPTSALATVMCFSFDFGALTKAFALAVALVAFALVRTLAAQWGRSRPPRSDP
jgi:predicted RND superfamily exporter protein